MRLIELQRHFRDWLREEDADARTALGGCSGPGIYLNNHRASLMASLSASYERTARWMGEDMFASAAACYVEAYVPDHWTLDAYGAHFAELLAELHGDNPELADMARVEWALEQAFIAADAQPLQVADMAGIDWEVAALRLVPSAHLLPLSTNADMLIDALSSGGDNRPAVELSADTASPLLVWRKGFTVQYRRATADEAHWLPLLRNGLLFAQLCDAVGQVKGQEEAIQSSGAWLAQWTIDQLLVLSVSSLT